MQSLKKNFTYSIFYQILTIILPLITAPYIARVLGPSGVGEYSYTYSVANYFVLMAMLGISQHGNRTIASDMDNVENRSKDFWSIYSIQGNTHIIAIVVYIIYICLRGGKNSSLLWIQLIYLISSTFDISWFFFGMEQFRITVLRNTMIKLSTVLLIFLLVKSSSDLWIYALILAGGTLVSQVYLWIYLRKYILYSPLNLADVTRQIKPILILFIPVLAYSIYKVMDKIMLGVLTTYEQVGFYENAYKINNIPIGFITAIGTVMLPRMTAMISGSESERGIEYIKKTFSIINLMLCAVVFGIAGISKNFVHVFYGDQYSVCASLMVGLNWSVFFIAWANIMRTQYLIPNKMDKIYVSSTVIGAIVNFIVNFMLIPRMQAMGAVIGTFVAEFSVMFVQMIFLRKVLPVWKYVLTAIPYYIIGATMLILISFLGKYLGVGIMTLLIQIIVGGIFFVVTSVITAFLRKDGTYTILIVPVLKRLFEKRI